MTIPTVAMLADGVPFRLGMTVVFENGREVATNEKDYAVEELNVFAGKSPIIVLKRKGGCGATDLNCLYSSQQTRVDRQVRYLNFLKDEIDAEIEFLSNGGSPQECRYLNRAQP